MISYGNTKAGYKPEKNMSYEERLHWFAYKQYRVNYFTYDVIKYSIKFKTI